MTYLTLNAVALAVAVALTITLTLLTPKGQRASGRSMFWTTLIVLMLTGIFDNVMIAIGLVDYDPVHISGVKIGVAPIEDFSYTLAAALVLPALWHALKARSAKENGSR